MALTTTRLILKNYALHSIGKDAVDPTSVERYERCIENAIKALGRYRDWSFQQDVVDLVTTAPYSTGTVTIPSTTAVTFSGTTLPSNVVGQVLKFSGETNGYEITVRGSDTAATILSVYAGNEAADTAGETYVILFPLVDLPANFKKHIALYDPETDEPLGYVGFGENSYRQSQRTGSGTPELYTFKPKRHDVNVRQLMLYPPPATKRIYQLAYFRQPGWFDTSTVATNAWKREATADTDYVDWPDDLMHVLRAAIQAAVAEEYQPGAYLQYQSLFELKAKDAANKDQVYGQPKRLSRGESSAIGGTLYRWGA